VNFVSVAGDVLFANETRSSGSDLLCPDEKDTITATAPFTVSPLEGGEYVLAAYFDRRGRFLPSFSTRNQPEEGDVLGGYVDLAAAASTNPLESPDLVSIAVGERDGSNYIVPDEGFLVDNVPVTIGRKTPLPRPYFSPKGAASRNEKGKTSANPKGTSEYVPVVTMTQDHHVLAPPSALTPETIAAYQASFVSIRLDYGVPSIERKEASDKDGPFALPFERPGGLFLFSQGRSIPESASVPAVWPSSVFSRLVADLNHDVDRQSLTLQGAEKGPGAYLFGVTLMDDTLAATTAATVPPLPSAAGLRDHVTVLLRPAVVCIDPRKKNDGGLLVVPHLVGQSADPAEAGEKALLDPALVKNLPFAREVKRGCLPEGRYAITLLYPTSQAWTVPNEAGSCDLAEGDIVATEGVGSCLTKPRPVLYSQGTRAVLEIVPPETAEGREVCKNFPVPDECKSSP